MIPRAEVGEYLCAWELTPEERAAGRTFLRAVEPVDGVDDDELDVVLGGLVYALGREMQGLAPKPGVATRRHTTGDRP